MKIYHTGLLRHLLIGLSFMSFSVYLYLFRSSQFSLRFANFPYPVIVIFSFQLHFFAFCFCLFLFVFSLLSIYVSVSNFLLIYDSNRIINRYISFVVIILTGLLQFSLHKLSHYISRQFGFPPSIFNRFYSIAGTPRNNYAHSFLYLLFFFLFILEYRQSCCFIISINCP